MAVQEPKPYIINKKFKAEKLGQDRMAAFVVVSPEKFAAVKFAARNKKLIANANLEKVRNKLV